MYLNSHGSLMMIDKKLSIRLDVRLYCVCFGHGDYGVLMVILWERLERFGCYGLLRVLRGQRSTLGGAPSPSQTLPDTGKA
jgi:hypothetical protein